MDKVNIYDIKGVEFPAGRLSRVILGDNGVLQGDYFVQGFSEIYPNGGIPEHHHEPEETYFIISGTGKMTVEGKTFSVKTGDLILIRPNEKHSLFNDSEDSLNIMYVYAPKIVVDHWSQELSGDLK